MKRVTGLGGVFFKCRDREKTLSWYEKHLGIPMEPWGAQFFWEVPNASDSKPYSVLGMFKEQTDYFEPSSQPFMINFRVDDLDALVAQLRKEGVTVIGEPLEEEFGKFAWIMDPEGNKIELWEQTK
ncbi:MAG: VOC family protein [Lewinellaceae bacterium]|nr:VOC family protein [Saprospiraceae bacterium]MCB9315915.1 VOC family protein [Lewinellaceae bacterium]MCB9330554.1 VOC family protein [Lewinellaceae bacterium]